MAELTLPDILFTQVIVVFRCFRRAALTSPAFDSVSQGTLVVRLEISSSAGSPTIAIAGPEANGSEMRTLLRLDALRIFSASGKSCASFAAWLIFRHFIGF